MKSFKEYLAEATTPSLKGLEKELKQLKFKIEDNSNDQLVVSYMNKEYMIGTPMSPDIDETYSVSIGGGQEVGFNTVKELLTLIKSKKIK